MGLSNEDKTELSSYLDTWLTQAVNHIKGAVATPPAPPKVDPSKDGGDPPKDGGDPPKDGGDNNPPKLFTSKSWFGDRA